MYVVDLACETPPGATTLWRYMQFPAFVSILQSSRIWFASLNELATVDPYEAAWAKKLAALLIERFRALPEAQRSRVISTRFIDLEGHRLTSAYCVNCWHMNDGESAAMWRLYSGEFGLAIRTTCDQLISALASNPVPVRIGRVQYADLDSPKTELDCIFHKRPCFRHEQELRAVVVQQSSVHGQGCPVGIDLTSLINEVLLSPSAPAWMVDVCKAELANYGLAVKVTRSALYEMSQGRASAAL